MGALLAIVFVLAVVFIFRMTVSRKEPNKFLLKVILFLGLTYILLRVTFLNENTTLFFSSLIVVLIPALWLFFLIVLIRNIFAKKPINWAPLKYSGILFLVFISVFIFMPQKYKHLFEKKETLQVPIAMQSKEKIIAGNQADVLSEKYNLTIKKENDIRNLITKGKQMLDSNNLAEALSLFNRALGLDKENKEILRLIEETNRKMENKRLEDLVAKQKKEIDDLILKGKEAISKNNLNEALSFFNQALALDKENKEVQNLIVETKKKLEDKYAQDLAVKKRKEIDGLIMSGKQALRKNDFSGALSFLKNALNLDKENKEIHTLITETEKKLAKKYAKEQFRRKQILAKEWKNELKAVNKAIDRNINFVKRMFNNIEDYAGYEIYDNLKTVANNLRTCAYNAGEVKEVDFGNSEDNKLREEVISNLRFACDEYAWAYDKIADNLQTTKFGDIHWAIEGVKFYMGQGNDAMVKAMLNLMILLNKYNLKY